jgi:integrase
VPHVLTVSEVFTLSEAIEPRYWALVLMATFMSLRWGELCVVRRSDIDLDARLVRVERSLTELESGALSFGPPDRGWAPRRRSGALWLLHFDAALVGPLAAAEIGEGTSHCPGNEFAWGQSMVAQAVC